MNTRTTAGGIDPDRLIRSMEPVLHDGIFVFASVAPDFGSDVLFPVMTFAEREGKTLIVGREVAEAENLHFGFPCSRMITLNVHSALEAVGFLARVTTRLAALQMGVNPVSAFFHDHLFVPLDRADDAMAELRRMATEHD